MQLHSEIIQNNNLFILYNSKISEINEKVGHGKILSGKRYSTANH